jgi:UrcA family protein
MNFTTHGSIFSVRSAALLLTLFLGANAFAGDPAPSETIKFQDLNVDSAAGVAALYQRIHTAAQRVCDVDGDRSLARQQQAKLCANEAEAVAVTRVNSPALTGYFQMKTGRQVAVYAANRAD